MAIRKVHFRTLIGPDGFAGLDSSGRLTAPSRDVISVKDAAFGAKGDGSTDDTASLSSAHTYAQANGKRLHFPAGVYVIDPASLDLSVSASLAWSGDGASTVIRLKNSMAGTTGGSRRMFRFNVSASIDFIDVSNMVVDGNARGSAAPDTLTQFEQSHAFNITGASGVTVKLVRFHNVIFKDPNADGIKNSSHPTATILDLVVSNCHEIDRTTFRSGIQMSRMPHRLTVTGYTGARIEVEEDIAHSYDRRITLSNCHVNKIDIGFHPDSTVAGQGIIVGCTTTVSSRFAYGEFKVSNSDLILSGDGRMLNAARLADFVNTTIRLPFNAETGAVVALDPRPTSKAQHVTFAGCHFDIDAGGSISVASNAALIYGQEAAPVADLANVSYLFDGCTFDSRAAIVARAYRNGRWTFRQCRYAASAHVFTWFSSDGYAVELVVDGGDFSGVTGAFISAAWSTSFDQTTAIRKLVLLGQHYGAASSNIATTAGQPTGVSGITNARQVVAPSLPTAAIQGDRYSVNQPAAGGVCEYVATTGSATAATWKAAATLAA